MVTVSHAGREAREVFKTLPWAADGDDEKFDKVVEEFDKFCSPQKEDMGFGPCNKATMKQSMCS